jgi:hypothetical protein
LIDNDDPAFAGIVRADTGKQVQLEDENNDEDGDGEDDDGVGGKEQEGQCVVESRVTNDDVWISAIYEDVSLSRIAMLSLNVKAHRLQIHLMDIDTMRQGLKDHLDLIKVV